MRRFTRIFIAILFAAAIFASCNKIPDNVLDKPEMAAVLADMHRGEVIVDYERNRFYNDSLKKTLRQSLLAKHGITMEQLDASFDWYGHHIEDYMEVYDMVIAQLEDDMKNSGIAESQTRYMARGDSVNLWTQPSFYRISAALPANNLHFVAEPDTSAHAGDCYSVRFKLINKRGEGLRVHTSIFAEYTDSLMEFRSQDAGSEGWFSLALQTDSTKTLRRVFGSLTFEMGDDEMVFVDSVMLVRTRLDARDYYTRGNQRRLYAPRGTASSSDKADEVKTAEKVEFIQLPDGERPPRAVPMR